MVRPPSIARHLALCGALAIAVGVPARARGYERARVEGAPELGVYWPARAIEMRRGAETGGLLEADLRAATLRSLATWSGAGGCTDVAFGLGPAASAETTNLDGGPYDGENRIVLRRAWPALVAPETIALTTYAYRPSTGEILDADINVDIAGSVLSAALAAPPPDAIDLENTLTHELGHVLGFAHVSDPEATMFVASAVAETLKRDLSPDDVAAVCETYPIDAVTPPAAMLPDPPATGCATAPRAPSRSAGTVAAALALLGALSGRALARSARRARRGETACGAT